MALAAVGAAATTAMWAVLLSDTNVVTFVAAGCLLTLAVNIGAAVWLQVTTQPAYDIDWVRAGTLAAVFCTYQSLLYVAFATVGPLAQTIVNCNVVFIFAWTARAQPVLDDTVATAVACVLYALLGAFIVHTPSARQLYGNAADSVESQQ